MITQRQKADIVIKFLKGRLRESKREFRGNKKGDMNNFPLLIHIDIMQEWVDLMLEHKDGYYF